MIRLPDTVARVCLAVVLIFIISGTVRAYFSLEEWHYVKTLTLPTGIEQGTVVALVLDQEVYAGSATEREAYPFAVGNGTSAYELPDLRLVKGAQNEIPYMLELLTGEEQRTELPVAFREESEIVSGMEEGIRFILDLGKEKLLHNEVGVKIRGQNRKRVLRVEASNDRSGWESVASKEIYDYGINEATFSTMETRIRYPNTFQSQKRYIRVTIASTFKESLEVLDVNVFRVLANPSRSASYPADLRDIQERKMKTILTLDTGIQGLPHNQVRLEIVERNFTRYVNLESSSTRKEWNPLTGGGVISSYDTPQISGRDLVVSYQETANRYLRLTIDNQDSPPLTFSSATVVGGIARIVFIANPGEKYQIYYGSAGARKPSYDLNQLFPFLLTQKLPEAQPGVGTVNPHYKPPRPALTERYAWLLPVVVTFMAILLLGLLVGTIRNARRFLPPPPFSH